jgi:hypothetical protein
MGVDALEEEKLTPTPMLGVHNTYLRSNSEFELEVVIICTNSVCNGIEKSLLLFFCHI